MARSEPTPPGSLGSMDFLPSFQATALAFATWLGSAAPQAADGVGEIRVELRNGVRLTSIPLEGRPRQSTVTVVPLSLLDDPEGQAGAALLLARMMMRTTDPKAEFVDDVSSGAEVGSAATWFQTTAPLEHWEVALVRHTRWVRPPHWEEGASEEKRFELLFEPEDGE